MVLSRLIAIVADCINRMCIHSSREVHIRFQSGLHFLLKHNSPVSHLPFRSSQKTLFLICNNCNSSFPPINFPNISLTKCFCFQLITYFKLI